MIKMLQAQIQALECSICRQMVNPKDVHVGNVLLLLIRLKQERFALCPSCTQTVSVGLQSEPMYQATWTRFVSEMIKAAKRGVRWHVFKPISDEGTTDSG